MLAMQCWPSKQTYYKVIRCIWWQAQIHHFCARTSTRGSQPSRARMQAKRVPRFIAHVIAHMRVFYCHARGGGFDVTEKVSFACHGCCCVDMILCIIDFMGSLLSALCNLRTCVTISEMVQCTAGVCSAANTRTFYVHSPTPQTCNPQIASSPSIRQAMPSSLNIYTVQCN